MLRGAHSLSEQHQESASHLPNPEVCQVREGPEAACQGQQAAETGYGHLAVCSSDPLEQLPQLDALLLCVQH